MLFPMRTKRKPLSELFAENNSAILEYNQNTLPSLILITFSLMCIPIVLSIFRTDLRESLPGYLMVLAGCAVLWGIFRLPKMKKYSLWGIYAMFTLVFLLTLYLSLVIFPERFAASILSFFCVMPLLFVDKPLRMDSVLVVFYLIHLILAYKVKGPEIAGVDMYNCLVSVFLGAVCGNATMRGRLDVFEARRQLTIEKETDVLTGLSNRRKLFETIAVIEAGKKEAPRGVLMLDVDHFKELNDKFGHAAGDDCLKSFGELLSGFENVLKIKFYRYGGEEFVGMVYGCKKNDLPVMADSIRVATQERCLGEYHFTVSIGAAFCDDEAVGCEAWIARADDAVYQAKSNGRNSVVFWNEIMAR